MSPAGILETVLYARDLEATERFYRDVLDLEPFVSVAGRHLFYRCGNQVLLIFNPLATKVPPAPDALPVPPHVKFGVWEHGKFIGVVIYSRGTAPHIGAPSSSWHR